MWAHIVIVFGRYRNGAKMIEKNKWTNSLSRQAG
jgi:hypothetical protein